VGDRATRAHSSTVTNIPISPPRRRRGSRVVRLGTLGAGELLNQVETFGGAGSVAAHGVGAGVAGDRAQDEGDDDGVVEVAHDGDEVGDEVDGGGEVDQRQDEADPDAGGHGLVPSVRGHAADDPEFGLAQLKSGPLARSSAGRAGPPPGHATPRSTTWRTGDLPLLDVGTGDNQSMTEALPALAQLGQHAWLSPCARFGSG